MCKWSTGKLSELYFILQHDSKSFSNPLLRIRSSVISGYLHTFWLHFSISSVHKASIARAELEKALRHPPVWAWSILVGNQDMGEKEKKGCCMFTLVWD